MLTQSVTRYAVIGGLILVVLGAIAFAVHSLTTDRPTRSGPTRGGETRYQCDQCGKEFAMLPDDFARQTPDAAAVGGDHTAMRQPHCLLCGAKHAGWMMAQCPQCQKYYLPLGVGPARADDERTGDTCPHCDTDRAEWFRKEYPKGRKRQ